MTLHAHTLVEQAGDNDRHHGSHIFRVKGWQDGREDEHWEQQIYYYRSVRFTGFRREQS